MVVLAAYVHTPPSFASGPVFPSVIMSRERASLQDTDALVFRFIAMLINLAELSFSSVPHCLGDLHTFWSRFKMAAAEHNNEISVSAALAL